MNLDLKSYVKVYPNWIEEDICKNLIFELENVKWEKHHFYIYKNSEKESHDTDFKVSIDSNQLTDLIQKKIWKAIEQYIVKDFCFPWFRGWSGFSPVRYNKYETGTEMKKHCYHIQSLFEGERKGIPTLSVLGILNEDYEGGDFIMWGKEKIELKTGSVVVFPSNFMYPHEVTPITKGTRYSCISWVW